MKALLSKKCGKNISSLDFHKKNKGKWVYSNILEIQEPVNDQKMRTILYFMSKQV